MSALDVQVGGGHYKDMVIQPAEFITRNKIGWLEGNVIKRVCRWRNKDGVKDLHKAIHELQLLIEMEENANILVEMKRQAAEASALRREIESTIDNPLGLPSTACTHTRQQLSPMEQPYGHVYQCVDCGARTVK